MKRFMSKQMRLQTKLTLLVFTVVLIALIVTAYLIGSQAVENAKRYQEEKVMDVAVTVGLSELVQAVLTGREPVESVQQYTEQVREGTDVQYIVVLNLDHLRLSHPNPDLIGKPFVGGDENRAFEGEQYTSLAEGTLGEALRAFVPVYADEKLVGVVAVGILTRDIGAVVSNNLRTSYTGIGIGLFIGSLGAYFLARQVKRTLHNLEPIEIAQLVQEREAVLQSVKEGIIAVDMQGNVIVVNESAKQLFLKAGLESDLIGKPSDIYLPFLQLETTLKTGETALNIEGKFNGVDVVMNRIPIRLHNETVGALATVQDKTELLSLIEQLSGVKTLAETLRIQTHEFMNKLHVIGAMVHTQSYEELKEYTAYLSDNYQKEIGAVSRLIQDPVIAGFLMNKLSQAREQSVEVMLIGSFALPPIKRMDQVDHIITIIGNLFDNAVDAVRLQNDAMIEVTMDYTGSAFVFSIADNGPGFHQDSFQSACAIGLSTKGKNRGYGLHLVQQALDELNGEVDLYTNEEGTQFTVKIPCEGDADDSCINR